jgi:transcriptional regulator with XRE-family HTH domain
MEFKEWLQAELTAREMTPSALASISKVPQPTIFRILSGETKDPRTGTVKRIERALGLQSPPLYVEPSAKPAKQLSPDVIVDFILSLQEDKRDEWLDWLAVHHPAPYRALMNRLVDDMKRNAPPPSLPPEPPTLTRATNTVSVSDKRLKQQKIAFDDRRKKEKGNA